MAISFTTSGATPSFGIPSQGTSGSSSSSGGSIIAPGAGDVIKGAVNSVLAPGLAQSNLGYPSPAATALTAAQNPSTPVKKQTVTNTDGSSTSTEYHAPAAPSASAITAAEGTSQSQSSSGVLPPAPIAPITNATISPSSNPTYNPYTGSTASSPTVAGGGYASSTSNNPNSQFESSNPNNLPSTTFPGIVSGLANTAQNGSANSTQATQGLLQAPAQNENIGENSQTIANQYAQEIQQAIAPYTRLASGQATTGTEPVAQGSSLATLNAANELGNQISNAGNLALTGNSQALTAQNQAQSGLEGAGTNANTQQANTQSGLNQAGILSTPQTTTPGQAVFNPQTGTYTSANSTNGAPGTAPAGYDQGVWNQYIQDLATNNLGAIPSAVTGNPAIYGQLQAAVPGFNYNAATGAATGAQALAAAPGTGAATGAAAEAAAPGQTAAQNTVTGGTAATTGTAASLQSTIGTYNTMSSYNTAADKQAQTVQSVLQSTGLNQGAPAFTKPLNTLSGQLGSANVVALTAAITEMQNSYSQLLNSGGTTPTGSETQALALLSPNSTPAQINSAITQLQTAAYNKLSGQYQQLQTESSALQSGTSNTNSNASNSSNPSGWF